MEQIIDYFVGFIFINLILMMLVALGVFWTVIYKELNRYFKGIK